MRNVLVVVNDEALINRMKIVFNNKDYEYFYTTEGSSAIAIADSNEIAVAIVDFRLPILSGAEICETLAAINLRMQFILLFEAEDIGAVLKFYNKYHINKLVCKDDMELKTVPDYIDDCMHMYFRREEILKMKEKVEAVSEKYLKPMTDMSNILNERLHCFEYIIKLFMCCINVHIHSELRGNKSLDAFVNRTIDDFIQLFMIKEPDANEFLNNLTLFYNKPDSKKYFKFVNNDVNIEDNKLNILFALDIITICFDTFFPMYRGKIELSEDDNAFHINSVYEIRYSENTQEVADKALNMCKMVLDEYCSLLKFARKDELIQFKASLAKQAGDE